MTLGTVALTEHRVFGFGVITAPSLSNTFARANTHTHGSS